MKQFIGLKKMCVTTISRFTQFSDYRSCTFKVNIHQTINIYLNFTIQYVYILTPVTIYNVIFMHEILNIFTQSRITVL